jgi:predicted secreted protein
MKPLARLLVLASTLAFAIGPVADAASASSSTPVYHQSDSGKTVSLAEGTTFKVRLKVCEDCGNFWHWKVRPDSDVVKIVSKKDVSSAKPPAVGGINTVTWTMKVVGPGDTAMKLVQKAASQNNKVVKRFTLYVAAGPSSGLPQSG